MVKFFGLRFAPTELVEFLKEIYVHHSPAINLEQTHGPF